MARAYLAQLQATHVFNRPIATRVDPAGAFYPAEGYHQNYFETNPRKPYCQGIIGPKVDKLRHVFADKLKASPEHPAPGEVAVLGPHHQLGHEVVVVLADRVADPVAGVQADAGAVGGVEPGDRPR